MAGRRRAAHTPVAAAEGSLIGARSTGPTRRQTTAFLATLVALATAVAAFSYLVKPAKARDFELFYGTVILDDQNYPVGLDLASGKPTVQLKNAAAHVSATNGDGNLSIVPLATGTLLLNRGTGEFNMIDAAGLPAKPGSGGVRLPPAAGTISTGVAAGDSAYIVRTGAGTPTRPGTEIFLVNRSTIASALDQPKPGKTPARAFGQVGEDATAADFDNDRKQDGLQRGVAASANGDLWLLTERDAGTRNLRRFSLPPGSDPGVTLTQTRFGTVDAISALESASARSSPSTRASGAGAPTSGDSVALATRDHLQIFGPSGAARSVPLSGLADTDRIVPVSNAQRRFDFLFHSPANTWTLVSSGLDGDVGIHPIAGIQDAGLVPPAQGGAQLYTMSDTGRLYVISTRTGAVSSPGLDQYPAVRGVEQYTAAGYLGGEVFARGLRVVYNYRPSAQALVVFTDGSHPPRVVKKADAVPLNSSGGIAALAAQHANPGPSARPNPHPTAPPAPNPTEVPAPQPDTTIDCANATQIPHQPVLAAGPRGSRSLQVTWKYPVLSPQDCLPSTYSVAVETIDGEGTSSGPTTRSFTVPGQLGANIGGLFPNTRYRITVTAVINGVGTPSAPVLVQTSPEGPPPPTGVKTTVDDHGTWTVTWNSCAGAGNCVPTDSWQVQPSFCDGVGLSDLPAAATVIGDPTQRSFSWHLAGGAALLGRGLSFQVIGVGSTGLLSQPASDKSCTTSWARPNPAQLELVTGLVKSTVASGDSTSATATLRITGDANAALGGVGATVLFELVRPDGSIVATAGPGTETATRFDHIAPGVSYRARAIVTPPGHPDAATTIGPVDVQAVVSEWPDLTLAATFDPGTSDSSGTLSVSISGVSSAAANRERFSLVGGVLKCPSGTGGQPSLQQTGFDPAAGPLTFVVDRIADYGDCTVSLALSEDGSPPLIYGGTDSPTLSASVVVDAPGAPTTAYWKASWAADGSWQVDVTYDPPNPLLSTVLTDGWAMTLTAAGSADPCGTATNGPDATIAVVSACQQTYDSWSVHVHYRFAGANQDDDVPVTGSPPVVAPPPASETPTPPTTSETPPPTSETPTPTPTPTDTTSGPGNGGGGGGRPTDGTTTPPGGN